jgi:hypothetical protein
MEARNSGRKKHKAVWLEWKQALEHFSKNRRKTFDSDQILKIWNHRIVPLVNPSLSVVLVFECDPPSPTSKGRKTLSRC